MDNGMIDLTGLDKAEVLCALYNRAKPQGLGLLHFTPEDMHVEEARLLLMGEHYFDYVHGRVLKVDLSSEALDPRLYDRDNGAGACAAAVDSIRSPA